MAPAATAAITTKVAAGTAALIATALKIEETPRMFSKFQNYLSSAPLADGGEGGMEGKYAIMAAKRRAEGTA